MPDSEKKPHFFEHPAFKGAAAVVALAVGVVALLGPLKSIVDDLFPSTEPVSWVEVVLDTSAAMGEEFDGETRLQAATRAIGKSVKELDNSGLGLRRTATSCGGESEKVIELGDGHPDKVVEEAEDLQPDGSSSIVDAVIGGLEEFQREPMASRGPQSRRLFVFTAGVSECPGGNISEEIAEALSGAGISQSSKVELIALGASPEEEEQLKEFKAALDGYAHVDFSNPEDQSELDDIAEKAGEQADAVTEHLEGEREAGFYEQP